MIVAPVLKRIPSRRLSLCRHGQWRHEIALRFNVSESWVRRIKQERREQGKTAPLLKRNRVSQWMFYSDDSVAIYSAGSDTTMKELKAKLGTRLSTSTLCVALRKLKVTYKKIHIAAEQKRRDASLVEARQKQK
ncbi:hypothetical protein OAE37_02805 [Pirellulaceae bacterium]|nr:hypothetical protein [Pirellulaceae bacterium]